MKKFTVGLALVAMVGATVLANADYTFKDASGTTQTASTVTDGSQATIGAKGDTACGTATGTCSVTALLKFLNTAASGALPAGTNLIGKVGIDQTTPGTTNAVAANQYLGGIQTANEPCRTGTKAFKAINGISTATSTLLVTNPGSGKVVYVCHVFLNTSAAEGISLVDGTTGGTCGSGTDALIGDTTANTTTAGVQLAANQGFSLGSGSAAIAATAANKDLCLVTGSTGQVKGSIVTVTQ